MQIFTISYRFHETGVSSSGVVGSRSERSSGTGRLGRRCEVPVGVDGASQSEVGTNFVFSAREFSTEAK